MFTKSTSENTVSVTLSSNHLVKDRYVVRVPRNTVKLNEIITSICDNYPSLDPYVINHSAELLKHEILKLLKSGKAVNVLELGTLYLAGENTVSNTNPQVENMPKLTLKFASSKEAVNALSNLSVDSFMVTDCKPQIQSICSLKDGNCEGILHKGFGVRLSGYKLKLAGEGSGIFFVPLDNDNEPATDESTWIKADTSYLPQNKMKEICFNLPDALQSGKPYYIALRTSYLTNKTNRKSSMTGFSTSTVTVA